MNPTTLQQVLEFPCARHDPLEDDDLDMEDDEIEQGGQLVSTTSVVWSKLDDVWTSLCTLVASIEL